MADRIKGITVQIGGDTTGLSKALSGVNKEIGSTQKELKDVEKLLKMDPKNTELLRQKYELLGKQVQDTEAKLEALKDAEKQVQDRFQRGEVSEQQYNALKREIIETESKLGRLKEEAQKTENAVNGIDEDPIEEVARAADDAETSLEGAGKEASNFGDYLKAGAIIEGAKGLASSLKDAAESSKEYMKVMGSLEVSSEKAGYSAEETAETYRALYGVLGDNQTAATTTANLQAIGLAQDDLNRLIKGSIGAWATYGDSIPIDGLAESINETIRAGQVTGTFADVLNWGSKEGETFGVTLKENTEANKDWNDAVKDAKTAEDFFNLALQDANSEADRANIVLKAMAGQGLEEAGDAWRENNEALIANNEANADYEESMAKLAEKVMPILTKITEFTSKLIDFILDNKDAVVTALLAIGTGFAVFKIVGTITSLTSSLQTLFSVIAANPITLIVTAIAGLVAAFIYLWNNCEEFREFWINLWEGIKKVFSDVWDAIVGFFTETIPDAIGKVTEIFQKFDDWLTGIFSTDWTEQFGMFGNVLNGFFSNVKNIWEDIKRVFSGIIDFVTGIFTGDWEKAWNGVKGFFEGIWNGLVDVVKAPINGIIGLINSAIDGINWIIDGINSIAIDIPDWLGGGRIGFNLGKIEKLAYLAKGGVLSQGSAVVGEAGPELLTMAGNRAIVQPLTTQTTNTTNLGGVNIYVYGAPGQDVGDLADLIMDKMETQYRMKAGAWR